MRVVGEPRWSVIIPAYNEALRLPAYLGEVIAYFDGRDEPYEVLVVDDGSRDETAARVLEAQAAHASVTLYRLAANHGKGFAVRAGMRAARGELRLMADADGATPIGEVKRLEAAIHAGADVAIGSRALADPSVSRHVRLHRKLSGDVFNFLVRRLGVPEVSAPVDEQLHGIAREQEDQQPDQDDTDVHQRQQQHVAADRQRPGARDQLALYR